MSYAVSYLFIAIVWLNHHHLFGYAEVATSRLLWFNFAQLFSVSLIPFATEWIAESRLANAPVALYAAVFVLVTSPTSRSAGRRSIGPRTRTSRSGCADCCG